MSRGVTEADETYLFESQRGWRHPGSAEILLCTAGIPFTWR